MFPHQTQSSTERVFSLPQQEQGAVQREQTPEEEKEDKFTQDVILRILREVNSIETQKDLLDLLKTAEDKRLISEIYKKLVVEVEQDSHLRGIASRYSNQFTIPKIYSFIREKNEHFGTDVKILALLKQLKERCGLETLINNLVFEKGGVSFLPAGFVRSYSIFSSAFFKALAENKDSREVKDVLKMLNLTTQYAIEKRMLDEAFTSISKRVCEVLEVPCKKEQSFAFQVVFQLSDGTKREILFGFEADVPNEVVLSSFIENVLTTSAQALGLIEKTCFQKKVDCVKVNLVDVFHPLSCLPIALSQESDEALDKLMKELKLETVAEAQATVKKFSEPVKPFIQKELEDAFLACGMQFISKNYGFTLQQVANIISIHKSKTFDRFSQFVQATADNERVAFETRLSDKQKILAAQLDKELGKHANAGFINFVSKRADDFLKMVISEEKEEEILDCCGDVLFKTFIKPYAESVARTYFWEVVEAFPEFEDYTTKMAQMIIANIALGPILDEIAKIKNFDHVTKNSFSCAQYNKFKELCVEEAVKKSLGIEQTKKGKELLSGVRVPLERR